jgi:hypothetical protein
VNVYVDQIYHTFAFVAVPAAQAAIGVKGTALDAQGKPMNSAEVLMTAGGKSFRTFTDQFGRYSFPGSSVSLTFARN